MYYSSSKVYMCLEIKVCCEINTQVTIFPEKTKESAQLYMPTKNVIEIITPHFKEHQNIFEKIQDKAKETSDKIKKNFKQE